MAENCIEPGCGLPAVSRVERCRRHADSLYQREKRKRDPDHVRAIQRAGHERNRDQIRERDKRRYQTTRASLKYYHANSSKISETNKAKRRPLDLLGWAKHVCHKISVNVSTRKAKTLDAGSALRINVILPMVESAYLAGDVKFDVECSAPSPDRIDGSRGYHLDNIQIVPAWLNYAYHDWDKVSVEREILEWAKRRLHDQGL